MYVASIDTPFFIKLQRELPSTFQTITLDDSKKAATGGTPGPPGHAIYEQNCQMCHGADRAGNEAIPSLQNVITRLGPDEVYATVRNGRGQMPAFSNLTDAQVNSLISYLEDQEIQGEGRPTKGYHPPALGGPVVASGGAPAAEAYLASMPAGYLNPKYGMSGGPPYPVGSGAPAIRLYTGYDAHREIVSPPWSSLTAYDLNKGTIKWKIPYGEDPVAVAAGIHNTGIMQDQRSVLVTPTGLLFAATTDGYLRALDADTGKVLWSTQLPASAYGIPAMYVINGKTYIVVCAAASRNSFGLPANWKLVEGGSGGSRAYVAFALPDK
jgi:quinoprotein glucose dehydrogenase